MPRVKKAELERRALREATVRDCNVSARACAQVGIDFPEAEVEAIAAYRALIRLAEVVGGKPSHLGIIVPRRATAPDCYEGNMAGPAIGPQTTTSP